jgi:alkylation response protein AidB-like acyl-CoA dehydrogenase
MDFQPNEDQAAVAATARAYARERIAPAVRENDRSEKFPVQLIRGLGELGLLAVNVPAEFGGSEAGAVASALSMMELAAVDASVAVIVGVTNMVAEIIARYGSPEQKARHLPRLASGEYLAGAFGLSEPGAGSDPAAISTRAVRRGEGWVLDGAKQWITSGDVAGVVVVWARTEPALAGGRGITAFLLQPGMHGFSVGRHEEKMGQRCSSTVSLAFDGVEVPDEARLGAVGQGLAIALSALDGGRIGIAAQATGTMRAAIDAAATYAKERTTFGKPIAEHQAIAFMLADMATWHDAGRLMTLRAAMLKETGASITQAASMAKLFASEASQRVVDAAVQIHGGYGYTEEYPVAKLYRDARVQRIYEGTSEIQRMVIARNLLREP